MPSTNDENTRNAVRASRDNLATLFSHFDRPDATWETFGKKDVYLEYLKLSMTELLHCVEVELQNRNAVEPVEYGS